MKYTEGDVVLCTVDKVENTICFVHLPDGTKGTIISSEIAPGRIKFMRAYVVPNKKIVCKVLKISGDNIALSLRRVNPKEKKQVMQEFKQELANKAALKQILGEDYQKTKEKILEKYSELILFIETAREDETVIETLIPKKYHEQIKKITEKKKRQVEIRYTVTVKSLREDGVTRIKELFDIKNDKIKITYISAGQFKIKYTASEFKEGKQELYKKFEELEKKAKELEIEFEFKEEKN
jgi:translation initiation factor 2 alpha subunit (eIF-2alpha)